MEINIPPITAPSENIISIAVRRHTSSPKVRAVCKGVSNAAGDAKKLNNALKPSVINAIQASDITIKYLRLYLSAHTPQF
jgi:hypothetical protein